MLLTGALVVALVGTTLGVGGEVSFSPVRGATVGGEVFFTPDFFADEADDFAVVDAEVAEEEEVVLGEVEEEDTFLAEEEETPNFEGVLAGVGEGALVLAVPSLVGVFVGVLEGEAAPLEERAAGEEDLVGALRVLVRASPDVGLGALTGLAGAFGTAVVVVVVVAVVVVVGFVVVVVLAAVVGLVVVVV